MKVLIINDSAVDLTAVNTLTAKQNAAINLFSFTSNFVTLEKIQQDLQTKVTMLDSAALINVEVETMRRNIHHWSHALGNLQIKNKKLKDWFQLPDNGGSSWWFGIIAEKNSVQVNTFFKMAQINAVATHLKNNNYDRCFLGLNDKKQTQILKKMLANTGCKIQILPCLQTETKSFKRRLMDSINNLGFASALFAAMIYWFIWLKDSRAARKALPSLASRLSPQNNFLFVTYFPNIDEEAGKAGIFRNKYALPLQEKLAELNTPVTWLAMPVYYNGHNFASSMNLIKKFIANGEKIFVLQEFFTLKTFMQAFGLWLRQSLLSWRLLRKINQSALTADLTPAVCLPLIKHLWWDSFVGASGVRGIIFYLTYLEMFKRLTQIKTCLYYCEMQAWEKALLLAKKRVNPAIKTMAFQHTVVMKNYFNYFYHPDEITPQGIASDFPLPDKLIANGKLMRALLAESRYPQLHEAEAIRQLYITKRRPTTASAPKQPVLLVVGSYDRVETSSLITMVYQAFPKAHDFQIWFKGSPVNPVEILFNELNIDWRAANYQDLHTDVAELLQLATITLIANTTVAIEAIAFGCPLIIPLLADTMLMNPVIDTDATYHLVSDPTQLKNTVNLLLTADKKTARAANKEFIHSYWHLDNTIPQWTHLLTSSLCDHNI